MPYDLSIHCSRRLLFLLLPATSFRARKEDATSPRAIRRARIIRFFNPFFFSTRDKQGDKTGDNSLPLFLSSKDLSREKGRTGQPRRPHRCRSRATWIHPKSNLPATQTRWLNALICTRLCDRDGKGGGGQVCMCIDASDGIARERDFVDGAYAKRSRFNQLLGISH